MKINEPYYPPTTKEPTMLKPNIDGPVRYPTVEVGLIGEDGNTFAIIGKVNRALRRAGATKDEIDRYCAEATAGTYDELLATTMRWVEVA